MLDDGAVYKFFVIFFLVGRNFQPKIIIGIDIDAKLIAEANNSLEKFKPVTYQVVCCSCVGLVLCLFLFFRIVLLRFLDRVPSILCYQYLSSIGRGNKNPISNFLWPDNGTTETIQN